MSLLLPKYAPVTCRIGFIASPRKIVADEFSAWMHKTLRRTSRCQKDGELAVFLASLEPLDTEGRTALFTDTSSRWTACFENSSRSPEVEIVVSYVARRLQTDGVVFFNTPRTIPEGAKGATGSWGEIGFKYYQPSASHPLGLARSVTLVGDFDGFQFDEFGEILSFESGEVYKRRRRQERVTVELLHKYAGMLDINLGTPSYYGPGSETIFADLPFRRRPPGMSYSEAQSQLGLLQLNPTSQS